jgi:hypothetical protein
MLLARSHSPKRVEHMNLLLPPQSKIKRCARGDNVAFLPRTSHPANGWDALTVALVRRQHEHGELPVAVLDAMMSAIGLPA